ncbi:MAG: hypothetical protein RBU37_16155 [Myxococcota bacterium]|nr:hypothetical protein [Myxococcota bacterium]
MAACFLVVALSSGILACGSADSAEPAQVFDRGEDAIGIDTSDASQEMGCIEGTWVLTNNGRGLCLCSNGAWTCAEGVGGEACLFRVPAEHELCSLQTVFAPNADGGCCRYPSACLVPEESPQFFSENACKRGCELGVVSISDGGCERCACEPSGWRCEDLCPLAPSVCASDEDCVVSGCFGQVCSSVPDEDSCEWRSEYGCFHEPVTSCICQSGVCEWAATPELDACIVTQCVEGEQRLAVDGCNQCWCDEWGSWNCTQRECSPCPEPRNVEPCEPWPTWAQDPVTGACCEYQSSCQAPEGWALFDDAAMCGTCRAGDVELLSDGCTVCYCLRQGQWACLDRACETPCQEDADCVITGCLGEFCAPAPLYSACDWQPQYACLNEGVTACACQGGICGWTQSPELVACQEP